jgi:catechol 2,3-dioxygenase-like lactoylglutathione lyase family enzyme
MIFDHISIRVSDYKRARAFFVEAFAPLDLYVVTEGDTYGGFGREGRPQFWISQEATPTTPLHIAFAAATREAVREFHRLALAAGGTDNGAPGIRPDYAPTYYAAFVIGPDGHNFEAVTHVPSD